MNPIEVYFQCRRIAALSDGHSFDSKYIRIQQYSSGQHLDIQTPEGSFTVMQDTEVTRPGRWQETIGEYLKHVEEALLLKNKETSQWKTRDPIPPELDIPIPADSIVERYEKVTVEDWLELALMLTPVAFELLSSFKLLHKVKSLGIKNEKTTAFEIGGKEVFFLTDYGREGVSKSYQAPDGQYHIHIKLMNSDMGFKLLEG